MFRVQFKRWVFSNVGDFIEYDSLGRVEVKGTYTYLEEKVNCFGKAKAYRIYSKLTGVFYEYKNSGKNDAENYLYKETQFEARRNKNLIIYYNEIGEITEQYYVRSNRRTFTPFAVLGK